MKNFINFDVPKKLNLINMEYSKVIAVTGLPGLYELLNSKADGAIVRALDDKSTRFVSSRVHNFSHLESIEIYTVRDNVNLVEVLKAMEASSEKLPDEKDNKALQAYFTKVFPDLDFERVYSSDLKKMVKWFAALQSNQIELKLSEPEEGEALEDESGDEGSHGPAEEIGEGAKKVVKEKKVAKGEEPVVKAKKASKEEEAPAKEKTTKPSTVKASGGKKEVAAKEPAAKKSASGADKGKKKSEEKPKKTAKKK